MYRAELRIRDDWFTYNVTIYKNNEKLLSYNFDSLSSAYKLIAMFLPPFTTKENT